MKRLLTKADRLELQEGLIKSAEGRGYVKEEYNGLKILTYDDQGAKRYYMQVFRDAVARPIANYVYSSAEGRNDGVARMKKRHDERVAYTQRRKIESPRTAGCGPVMKEELKKVFPGVVFSVKSDSFSGGDSVRVRWTDGPSQDEVESIINKYQSGHFDGMNDIYEYSNRRDDIPQTKYVFAHRDMSPETKEVLEREYAAGGYQHENGLYRLFRRNSLPLNAKVTGITRIDGAHGCFEDCYRISYEGDETVNALPTEAPAAMEVKQGEVNVVEYSERAIAVIGDTKPIKDKLKALGGKFNAHLTCGAGWIFSKKRADEVVAALAN